ncbi:hypothetical protein GCM10029963_20740 [Micromonospora andamanensis]
MTGHLLVPALDPDLPATLSGRILGGLLREEMGFDGVVVTDAVEMGAVADRYGFAGAAVRALAAGADAICVGGEHADEETARHLRDAIVDAVVAGELPEERLAEAAKRVGQLAAWTVAARTARSAGPAGGSAVGLVAARRAVRITPRGGPATTLPLAGPAHVVEFQPPHNIAIGSETPGGGGTAHRPGAGHHERPVRRERGAGRPGRRRDRPAACARGTRPAPARLDAGRGRPGADRPPRRGGRRTRGTRPGHRRGAHRHPWRHPGRRAGAAELLGGGAVSPGW